MLENTQGKGFHMTFQNGYTASVQWGAENYCENRSTKVDKYIKQFETKAGQSLVQSKDAEVAVIFCNEFVTKQIWLRCFHKDIFDDVVGYVNAEDVAKVLAFVANL